MPKSVVYVIEAGNLAPMYLGVSDGGFICWCSSPWMAKHFNSRADAQAWADNRISGETRVTTLPVH